MNICVGETSDKDVERKSVVHNCAGTFPTTKCLVQNKEGTIEEKSCVRFACLDDVLHILHIRKYHWR